MLRRIKKEGRIFLPSLPCCHALRNGLQTISVKKFCFLEHHLPRRFTISTKTIGDDEPRPILLIRAPAGAFSNHAFLPFLVHRGCFRLSHRNGVILGILGIPISMNAFSTATLRCFMLSSPPSSLPPLCLRLSLPLCSSCSLSLPPAPSAARPACYARIPPPVCLPPLCRDGGSCTA